MNKMDKYETPEMEITRFDVEKSIMDDFGGNAGDGDITQISWESSADGGPTTPAINWEDD